MPRTIPNKRKLNEAYLRSLRPQAKAFLVWDTLQHGFAVRVLPSGRKTWLCIYRHNGRPRWYHIATVMAACARPLSSQSVKTTTCLPVNALAAVADHFATPL